MAQLLRPTFLLNIRDQAAPTKPMCPPLSALHQVYSTYLDVECAHSTVISRFMISLSECDSKLVLCSLRFSYVESFSVCVIHSLDILVRLERVLAQPWLLYMCVCCTFVSGISQVVYLSCRLSPHQILR